MFVSQTVSSTVHRHCLLVYTGYSVYFVYAFGQAPSDYFVASIFARLCVGNEPSLGQATRGANEGDNDDKSIMLHSLILLKLDCALKWVYH